MTLVPIALFWPLALWCFFARGPHLLYLFFATLPFGSFAVIPPAATGGLTFVPAPIVALLIIARAFLAPGGVGFFLGAALRPERLLALTLFGVVAVVATLFMPRVFAGAIAVVPFRGILTQTSALAPSTQNVSQLVYLGISVLSVFAFARVFSAPALRAHAIPAVCVGAAVAVGTGVIDFASQYVPIAPLLAPFRTGTYALLTDVVVLGGKRVVGLMPEASAFGALCLGLLMMLWFLRRALPGRFAREIVAPGLCLALVGMIWLAKSTGAYVGLALFLALAAAEWVFRAARGRREGLRAEFWFAFAGALGLVAVLVADPSALDPVGELVDRMVLTKGSSESFEQRGFWRETAANAFVASGGLGVGVGSTRASSALVAVFAATGLLGGLCYYAFVLQTLCRRAAPGDAEGAAVIAMIRWSFLPAFLTGIFNGSEDFGVQKAFAYGLATAVALAAVRARRRPTLALQPA